MEDIIRKAIEGGWKQPIGYEFVVATNTRRFGKNTANKMFFMWVLSQSLFWQALGKSCGWDKENEVKREYAHEKLGASLTYQAQWIKNSLRFHEINLTEGWEKAIEYLKEVTQIIK